MRLGFSLFVQLSVWAQSFQLLLNDIVRAQRISEKLWWFKPDADAGFFLTTEGFFFTSMFVHEQDHIKTSEQILKLSDVGNGLTWNDGIMVMIQLTAISEWLFLLNNCN